jgi:hypothetical protein
MVYADMLVIAMAPRSDWPTSEVLIGTMPGKCVCGGSHGRGELG